jgi:hypothetical protein
MKHEVSPVVNRRVLEIELIPKVQKEDKEKLMTALILTIHIQLDSSDSLPDLR